ncbi:hypothetical protein P691DRAFT_754242 [Macrolepiota fuliginosa MF-IS2]|uniref:Arrestin-like N-terminal domain-containing protein n=1 Tax=Macrolepiota fuliginosa MF-IS2 TaxID=1400762 RepID=A0A9P5XSY0_9AGAR|nr:hypothetical protein P691DRAFT_754242 [Macrolepiota fuliginosa MF-IS2]
MPNPDTPPRRQIRPLPPIPSGVLAQGPDFRREIQNVTLPYSLSQNHYQESVVTLASINSINTIQTVLPVYSSALNLVSSVAPNFDPPRYSHILSPPSESLTAPTITTPVPENHDEGRAAPAVQRCQQVNFTRHCLYLRKDGAGKPWATLTLISRTPLPNSKGRAPRFIGSDLAKGHLMLELESPTSVQSISLNMKGKLITTHREEGSPPENRDRIFLERSHNLYSKKSHGDPGNWGQCNVSRNRKPDGKMQGTYHFPFSFPFPTEVAVDKGHNLTPIVTYEMPPSHLERDSRVTVRYDMGLVIGHGRLKLDSRMSTNVIYVPRLVALPASDKRQAAYREGAFLPGPRYDPGGWHAAPPATLSGRFQDRATQLYLANPLWYTRGTVLPCYLKFSEVNFDLLDHLSSPNAVDLQLARRISFRKGGESISSPRGYVNEEVVVGTAAIRWLEGEIHLSRDLQPSCNYPRFIIEYYVEMMPFLSHSFSTDVEPGSQYPVIKQSVKIATFHQYGPVPIAFTPRDESGERVRRHFCRAKEEATLNASLGGLLSCTRFY